MIGIFCPGIIENKAIESTMKTIIVTALAWSFLSFMNDREYIIRNIRRLAASNCHQRKQVAKLR